MMLSICIPIYNFDVNPLVSALKAEIETYHLHVEIILIDDASKAEFQKINNKAASEADYYKRLPENIGRSAIRNLFLDRANGDYLLFLDCDGKIISTSFIKDYINYIETNRPNVLYGGRVVDKNKPESSYQLRWNYAQKRENLNVQKRRQAPYLGFQTNNFVIKKTVFESFKFNEKLKNYGYEDLLFAMELKDADIIIEHVDNPIFNNDIETNSVFSSKAAEAAESLAIILKDKNTSDKVSDLKLAIAYKKLQDYKLRRIFNLAFDIAEPFLKSRLHRGNVSLKILDFYKLGILSRNMSKA